MEHVGDLVVAQPCLLAQHLEQRPQSLLRVPAPAPKHRLLQHVPGLAELLEQKLSHPHFRCLLLLFARFLRAHALNCGRRRDHGCAVERLLLGVERELLEERREDVQRLIRLCAVRDRLEHRFEPQRLAVALRLQLVADAQLLKLRLRALQVEDELL
eukprot:3670767-Rhodomonas_salina.1